MEGKLLSVIVPVYNVKPYLSKCINSIISQTYKNIEIILVDDGSTDGSGEICDKYSMHNSRIKVIHKKNGGLASARNAGIDVAKGDFLGFVDSDDWIESDMYEELISGLISSNSKIACCGRVLYYGKNLQKLIYTLNSCTTWNSEEAIERLLSWNCIDSSACDKVFDKRMFDSIRFPEGKLHEDIFIMYKLLLNANYIIHIGSAKYNYRQRVGGITRNHYSHKKMDLLDAIEELELNILKKYPYLKKNVNAFCLVNVDIVIYQLMQTKQNKKIYLQDYKRAKNLFKRYGKNALFNNYISKQEKIKYILVKLHFTNGYISLKNLYFKTKL